MLPHAKIPYNWTRWNMTYITYTIQFYNYKNLVVTWWPARMRTIVSKVTLRNNIWSNQRDQLHLRGIIFSDSGIASNTDEYFTTSAMVYVARRTNTAWDPRCYRLFIWRASIRELNPMVLSVGSRGTPDTPPWFGLKKTGALH